MSTQSKLTKSKGPSRGDSQSPEKQGAGGRGESGGSIERGERGERGEREKVKSPGRPPGKEGERVRQDLLAAARQLFLSYEFRAVSVRQIAECAGVNGAMVNYYFGGKKGLYLAMVDEVFAALESALEGLDQGDSVRDFVTAYMEFLASNPWWPNFVVREVLFGQEEIRQSITASFAETFARRLIGAVSDEITARHYRSDLQPELATWSLMGMMVFPFLSRPIAQSVLHTDLQGQLVDDLITHTCELFEQGVVRREET